MTVNVTNNSSAAGQPIIAGDKILDKLLNQLSQADRELILRLMTEMGVRANDPMHPLLVALQYYVQILREIPSAMKSSADESVTNVAKSYGTIQTKIDDSITKIETKVDEINQIRVQWGKDVEALLPNFKTAFDEAKTTAIAAYQQETVKIDEESLQNYFKELESTRTTYLRDVMRQGWIWAGSATLIALLAVGGATYWFGTQHGRDSAFQDSYKAFGGQRNYNFAKALVNRSDNLQRIIKCQDDGNDKCTVWINDPPP